MTSPHATPELTRLEWAGWFALGVASAAAVLGFGWAVVRWTR